MIGTLAVDGWAVTFWYSDEEPGRTAVPPRPLIGVPYVTTHPSTASLSMWYYYYLCTLNDSD